MPFVFGELFAHNVFGEDSWSQHEIITPQEAERGQELLMDRSFLKEAHLLLKDPSESMADSEGA